MQAGRQRQRTRLASWNRHWGCSKVGRRCCFRPLPIGFLPSPMILFRCPILFPCPDELSHRSSPPDLQIEGGRRIYRSSSSDLRLR
ncbi:hypothetical protein U1Q18_031733 [Sarracenia purpurea var. burkii]